MTPEAEDQPIPVAAAATETVEEETVVVDETGTEWAGEVEAEWEEATVVTNEATAPLISPELAPKLTLDDAEPQSDTIVDLEVGTPPPAPAELDPAPAVLELPPLAAEVAPSYVAPDFDHPAARPAVSFGQAPDPWPATPPAPPAPPHVEPVQPYSQPAQPYAQPSQPYAQPSQPYYAEPAQAYAQPASPYAEPSQPYYAQPNGLTPYAAPASGSLSPSDENVWASAAHWSALVASFFGLGFLGPLLVLLIQGPKSRRVRAQAAESLNFEITAIIGVLISLLLMLVLVGFLTIFVVGIAWFILRIVGAVQAANGQDFRYPVNIRLVK